MNSLRNIPAESLTVTLQNGKKSKVLRWAIYKRPQPKKFEPLNISHCLDYDQLYTARQLTQPTPEMRIPSSCESKQQQPSQVLSPFLCYTEELDFGFKNYDYCRLKMDKFEGKTSNVRWKSNHEVRGADSRPQHLKKEGRENHLLRIKQSAEWLQNATDLRSKLRAIANFPDSRGGSLLISKLLKADACNDGTVSLDSLTRAVHDTAARAAKDARPPAGDAASLLAAAAAAAAAEVTRDELQRLFDALDVHRCLRVPVDAVSRFVFPAAAPARECRAPEAKGSWDAARPADPPSPPAPAFRQPRLHQPPAAVIQPPPSAAAGSGPDVPAATPPRRAARPCSANPSRRRGDGTPALRPARQPSPSLPGGGGLVPPPAALRPWEPRPAPSSPQGRVRGQGEAGDSSAGDSGVRVDGGGFVLSRSGHSPATPSLDGEGLPFELTGGDLWDFRPAGSRERALWRPALAATAAARPRAAVRCGVQRQRPFTACS